MDAVSPGPGLGCRRRTYEETLALVAWHLGASRDDLVRTTPALDDGVRWIQHDLVRRAVELAIEAVEELRRDAPHVPSTPA
jgi:hypothetical protein